MEPLPLLETTPTAASVARAALAIAVLLFGVWGAGRWVTGIGASFPPGDRSHPPTRLVGLDLFVTFHAAWLLGALAGVSLTPALAHLLSLLLVTHLVVFVLAAALWRQQSQRSIRSFLYGGPITPRIGHTAIKPFVRRLSLLGLSVFVAAFGGLQLERYGHISTPMIVWLVMWWGLLYPRFRHEDRQLSRWEMSKEPWGFTALWRELVFVPFFFSSSGWLVVDLLAEPPASSLWPPLALYSAAWLMLYGADRQRHGYALDPHSRIWGRPAVGVADRFLCSGWFRWLRRPDDVAEVALVGCIAHGVGSVALVQYALPAVLVFYVAWRARNEERYLLEIWGPDWERYLKRVRGRWIPGLL